MALLEVKEISKTFTQKKKPAHIVLENMSFNVEQGQYVSLLGPSGCGKTTLLTMLGGFMLPDAGQIYLAGKKSRDQVRIGGSFFRIMPYFLG